MKRMVWSIAIITVIIGASVLGIFNLIHVSDEMLELTSSAQKAVDDEDIKKAEELTEQLSSFWDQQHRTLILYVRHNDVDEISKYLSELKQLLEHGKYSEYSSRISHVELLLQHLQCHWKTLPEQTN